MNKLFKIILPALIVLFGYGFLFVSAADANGDTMIVEWSPTGSGGWQLLTGPIFSEKNFLPGNGVSRFIRVTNNSGQIQRIATEAINKNDPNNLASQMNLVIKQGATIIFNNTLKQLFNQGETYLSSLANGAQTTYEMTITFNSNANNDYQAKILGFDILVGFEGTEGGLQLPNPGQGEGTNSEGAGLTINNEVSSQTGETNTVITWFTSYKSTSRVVYGTNSGVFDLTKLNYGYDFTTPEIDNVLPISVNGVTSHSLNITGLLPNTTYYFRCISHASPPTISREFSFTTLKPAEKESTSSLDKEIVSTGNMVVDQGANAGNGQASLIRGEEVSSEQSSEEDGTVKGGSPREIVLGEKPAEEKSESNQKNFLASIGNFFSSGNYYWLLIVTAIVLIALFLISRNRKKA